MISKKETYHWEIKQLKTQIGTIEDLVEYAKLNSIANVDILLERKYREYMAKLKKKKIEYHKVFGEPYQI